MGIGILVERANSFAKTNVLLFRLRGKIEGSGILNPLHKIFDADIPEEDIRVMSDYVAANKEDINKVRDLLYDDESKKVYDSVIEYRCTGNKKCLISCPDMYFPKDIFPLTNDEVFVDCGSFDGDSVFEFIRQTRGKFKAVYAVEPSSKHFELLKKNTGKLKKAKGKINYINTGLWSEGGQLEFMEHGPQRGTSHIIKEESMPEAGSISLKVNTLDVLLQDKEPTIIKMDIEGSEMQALLGAINTIERKRPILAISVYHKFFDITKIPLFLMDRLERYNFLLRHHCGMSETVLYCLPF